MAHLAQQRCFHHAAREAVARCPECRRFFCRECVADHQQRVLCDDCLRKIARTSRARGPGLIRAWHLLRCVAAFIVAWFVFFALGDLLLRIPDEFHDGSLWQAGWRDFE